MIRQKEQEFVIEVKERERDYRNNNKASITMTNVHLEQSGGKEYMKRLLNFWLKTLLVSNHSNSLWGRSYNTGKYILVLIFIKYICSIYGFPGGSVGKESACNAEDLVQSLGQEDPLEKEMAIHSNILAYSPWGHKESDTSE